MNLNKVLIAGRLTANPELRNTPGGQSVASFSLATNRVWTDKSGARQESTEFHNIVVWGRQAEIANQFLTKGSLALIEGRLQTRSWQDKQGQTRKTTEIICERIQLGPKPGGFSQSQKFSPGESSQNKKPDSKIEGSEREDIPIIDIDSEKDDIKPEDLPPPLNGSLDPRTSEKFEPVPEPYLNKRASRTQRSMIPPSLTKSSLTD